VLSHNKYKFSVATPIHGRIITCRLSNEVGRERKESYALQLKLIGEYAMTNEKKNKASAGEVQESVYRCGMSRDEWIAMNSINFDRPRPSKPVEPVEELAGGRYLTLNERMTERARLANLRSNGGYGHNPYGDVF
jgi:hypothetical protein